MPKLCRWWTLCALASAVGFSTPVRAQTTIDVGPLVGYYRPLGHFESSSVYSTSLPNTPSELSAVTRGAVAHVSFGRRLGVEAQLSVAHSTIGIANTPAGPGQRTDALEVAVTLQGQYDVSPTPEKYRLWLSAGPGFIQHGGEAYAKFGSPLFVGGALGLGIAIPIGYHLQIAAGATTLFYGFNVKTPQTMGGDPVSLQRGSQSDALIHLGVRWGP